MIGRLSGTIIAKAPPNLLIDVNGVGYEVAASMNTIYKLPDVQQKVVLHTHFVVREDAQLLYGFYDLKERTLFRTLIKVNGVGPKLALTILSSIDADSFAHCVFQQDTATLVKLPGIGKKTAQRLVIEMRDRLDEQGVDQTGIAVASDSISVGSTRTAAVQDAMCALVSLGYKPQQASRALHAMVVEGQSSADLIREALRKLSEGEHASQ